MTRTTSPFRAACVACGQEKEIHYSLRLKREQGKWVSQPVCNRCRRLLIAEAVERGEFIPFFSIESFEREAKRRNEGAPLRQALLEKFAQARKAKPKREKPAKASALKAVASK
jgi:hypothetical protein